MNENNFLGTILAGGKSSRFGDDKSTTKLGDKTLLDHTINKIEKEFNEILVISNNKVIKDCTHKAKQKNSICGDQMEISLKIKENKITDFGYQCKSCVYCQASVSLLSSSSINKPVENIKSLLNEIENFFEDNLTNIPKEWKIFKKIFNYI